MKKELFPLAEVLTPNIPEAEVLTGKKIQTREEMEQAAEQLSREYGTAIVLKAVMPKLMQTICSMKMGKASGSRENGWSIEYTWNRLHVQFGNCRRVGRGLGLRDQCTEGKSIYAKSHRCGT